MSWITSLAKKVRNLIQIFTNQQTISKQHQKQTTKNIPSREIPFQKKTQEQISTFTDVISKDIPSFHQEIITVDEKDIPTLEPGYVLDTCALMTIDDYPEIRKFGRKISEKLMNKPIYVLTTAQEEYINKKCPRNRQELISDNYTGETRDFHNSLAELPRSLDVDIYFVYVQNSKEIQNLAKKLESELRWTGLHKGDSVYLAFSKLTNSTMITVDKDLIRCCIQEQCTKIEFHEFLEKLMQPSPISLVIRERRNYQKKIQKTHNFRNRQVRRKFYVTR